jgi:hypothetical protein
LKPHWFVTIALDGVGAAANIGLRMISLKKLLGRDDKFYRLLEASASEARLSVQALTHALRATQMATHLEEIVRIRRNEKAMFVQISEALCTTFVTALEREDIEALSFGLYRIPKTVEKVAERITIAPHFLHGIDFKRETDLLDQAADMVVTMMKELTRGIHLERIRAQNDQLQTIEGDADKALVKLLSQLYARQIGTVQAVFLKDIFELMEKIADRCRDVGNIINHIVLKNS